MSILRKYLIESLRKTYNNVSYTYGYEIKSKRIANRLASRTEYIYIKK